MKKKSPSKTDLDALRELAKKRREKAEADFRQALNEEMRLGLPPEDSRAAETKVQYMDRRAATAFIRDRGVPIGDNRLADLLYQGRGPKSVRINGRALYQDSWLLEWIEQEATRPVVVHPKGGKYK